MSFYCAAAQDTTYVEQLWACGCACLGEVIREMVELAEVKFALGPDEGRGLAEDEVPALLVLGLERGKLRLGHRPAEDAREDDEDEPLDPLVQDDGDGLRPKRINSLRNMRASCHVLEGDTNAPVAQAASNRAEHDAHKMRGRRGLKALER